MGSIEPGLLEEDLREEGWLPLVVLRRFEVDSSSSASDSGSDSTAVDVDEARSSHTATMPSQPPLMTLTPAGLVPYPPLLRAHCAPHPATFSHSSTPPRPLPHSTAEPSHPCPRHQRLSVRRPHGARQ